MLRISINTDLPVLEGQQGNEEIARQLTDIQVQILDGSTGGEIIHPNGQPLGEWDISEGDL